MPHVRQHRRDHNHMRKLPRLRRMVEIDTHSLRSMRGHNSREHGDLLRSESDMSELQGRRQLGEESLA